MYDFIQMIINMKYKYILELCLKYRRIRYNNVEVVILILTTKKRVIFIRYWKFPGTSIGVHNFIFQKKTPLPVIEAVWF